MHAPRGFFTRRGADGPLQDRGSGRGWRTSLSNYKWRSLRLFAPKVREGGYLFIDDYGPAYPEVVGLLTSTLWGILPLK